MKKTALFLTIASAPLLLAACQKPAEEPVVEPTDVATAMPEAPMEPAPAMSGTATDAAAMSTEAAPMATATATPGAM